MAQGRLGIGGMVAACVLPLLGAAAVRPGSPFCDNMVLQRGCPVPVWGAADPGERVTVSFAGQTRVATADAKGRWRVDLAPLEASKVPREMVIGPQTIRNVLVGEVWLAAGQSNMELPLWSEMPRYRDAKGAMVAQMTHLPNVRVGNIPITWKGSPEPRQFARSEFRWMEAEPENMRPIRKFSAIGFWFARELYLALDVPVAVLAVYQGGTKIEQWTGELFNEYLAPVAPYAVRGFLWYQGESNGAKGYCEKMHGLYGTVTNAFEHAALPMYFVQIPGGFDRALEQARFVREEPHAEMAVVNDVTNPHDVHPARKEIVAQRLVLHALARDYGFKGIVHRSPSAVAATASGDAVTVSFADAKELYIYNDDWSMSNRFEVAGANGKYAPAEILNMETTTNKAGVVQAKINGGIARDAKLVLRASGVASPRKVRYLHDGRQLGNIFSEVNLPLQPFEIEARPASDAGSAE